ncbi:MAG: tRNA (guanosine(46)-N7)-methyltransferase TrmB [Eubacteriales bacterium]
MRTRPKKNREKRLKAVSGYFVEFDGDILDIEKTFGVKNPKVALELGCGKGMFAESLSGYRPDCFILAVEKVTDVIMMAMERAARAGAANIKFANLDVALAPDVLPRHFADEIYINFCDPWPKKKNAKRRLTHPIFLEKYKGLLKDGASIFFKTDNIGLFEYSLETFAGAGFTLKNVCFDLHGDPALSKTNIMTEYEINFSRKGFKINYLEAFLP